MTWLAWACPAAMVASVVALHLWLYFSGGAEVCLDCGRTVEDLPDAGDWAEFGQCRDCRKEGPL